MSDEQSAAVEAPAKASNVVTSETFKDVYADKLFPGAKAEAAKQEAVESEKMEAEKAAPIIKTDPKEQEEERKERIKKSLSEDDQKSLDNRFSKLVRQREDSKREAESERTARLAGEARSLALEARIAELEKTGKPPEVVKTNEKPKVDQFKDAFEFAEALATWSAEKAIRERDEADAAKAKAKEQEEIVKAWKARQDAFAATTPDYSEVLADSNVNVSDEVKSAILDSNVGPQLLYHLASHPEIADEIAGKTVQSALRYIGRLEAKLEKALDKKEEKQDEKVIEKPVAKISSAPAPITPLKGISSIASLPVQDGVWKGTHKEFKAARAAGKI